MVNQSPIFLIGVVQGIVAALLYLVVARARRRTKLRQASAQQRSVRTWDILARGRKLKALPVGRGPFSGLWGFAYVAFLHYLFPLLWWRWGLSRAVGMVAAPFVATYLLMGVVLLFGSGEQLQTEDTVVLSLALQIPMRVAFGFLASSRDAEFRQKVLLKRGWRVVQSGIVARSASKALDLYRHPQGRARLPSPVERLRRLMRTVGTSKLGRRAGTPV